MSKHRSARIFVMFKTLTKIFLASAEYVLRRFWVLKFKMNITSAIAVSIVSGELDWKSLVRWWKTVDLSFCLIVPFGYVKHAGSGRIRKENALSNSMPFVAERQSSLPNKSLGDLEFCYFFRYIFSFKILASEGSNGCLANRFNKSFKCAAAFTYKYIQDIFPHLSTLVCRFWCWWKNL